jgi:hypothetical protein
MLVEPATILVEIAEIQILGLSGFVKILAEVESILLSVESVLVMILVEIAFLRKILVHWTATFHLEIVAKPVTTVEVVTIA